MIEQEKEYLVVFEDPLFPDEPARIMVPAPEWMSLAMEGGHFPQIDIYWKLQEDEQLAIDEGRHANFRHDPETYKLLFDSERVGPMTEEEAIEYLICKDVPKRVWGVLHNRPMFKIVKKEDYLKNPPDHIFRDAWCLNNDTYS